MGARKLTIEDLKNLDDGWFDKMVEKTKKDARGNDELAQNLLTERVLNDFFSSIIKKKENTNKCVETPKKPYKKAVKLAKDKVFKAKSYSRNNSKKKVMRDQVIMVPPENPQLPADFKARIEAMNGTNIKLVIHKKVYKTDLNVHHERISLPRTQIISKDFLRPEEAEFVHSGGVMDCKLIGPRPYYQSYDLKLRKWDSKTSWSYALTTKWPDFIRFYAIEEEIVKEGDVVQIWSFRRNSRLHMAFVKVEDNAAGGGGGDEREESGASTHEERESSTGTSYERGESSGTSH
ncbi:B3 domain-containing protein [Tripterygium wilfordii]|uniref:B3 domain-containing protein n=1 Tax=Tripterygium wilfordii TaxID=458696 RepID=A0A7J7CMD9_TRIWF|nr:uncharacterized protein LOC120017328 [Tripterygium wilfordii]KAF5735214.1 B3 domain-containing protein [Tripterygium wilfordii]